MSRAKPKGKSVGKSAGKRARKPVAKAPPPRARVGHVTEVSGRGDFDFGWPPTASMGAPVDTDALLGAKRPPSPLSWHLRFGLALAAASVLAFCVAIFVWGSL